MPRKPHYVLVLLDHDAISADDKAIRVIEGDADEIRTAISGMTSPMLDTAVLVRGERTPFHVSAPKVEVKLGQAAKKPRATRKDKGTTRTTKPAPTPPAPAAA